MPIPDITPTYTIRWAYSGTVTVTAPTLDDVTDRQFERLVAEGRFDALAADARAAVSAEGGEA